MEKNILEQKEYAEAPFQFYEQEYQNLIKWSLIRKVALSNKRLTDLLTTYIC